MVEHRVQRHFQRPYLALELGEQQAALERGECREGEVVGVGVEFAAVVHRLEAAADRRLPAQETAGRGEPCLGVGLGDLAAEGADRAAAAALHPELVLDQRVPPLP